MKLKYILIVACSLFTLTGRADEGMWMLGNLNKQTRKAMKELGLQMPADKLYNPKKPSLKDAVVSFGGFCSGVVVSEDGLVFTNHHRVYRTGTFHFAHRRLNDPQHTLGHIFRTKQKANVKLRIRQFLCPAMGYEAIFQVIVLH